MIAAYLALAAWFFAVDLFAAEVANVPSRPVAAAVLAVLWPLSVAFSLVASAAIIRKLREGVPHTTGGDGGE